MAGNKRQYYDICGGRARKKQPDWFTDAIDKLTPLLDDKAKARQRYLQLQSSSAKREFRLCQRVVKRAVDEAKETWINKVIGDAERRRDGKLRWDCIKKLQTAIREDDPPILYDFGNKMEA